VLAALEESEHAVAAYRSAAKLLPGDHRPLLYMGKELVRIFYYYFNKYLYFLSFSLLAFEVYIHDD